ncbi:KilA-N domain-containing protein [Pseudovibrio ascidiaceicola]|uniref:KilA-N domain-containing protein n=1 Tax=Pseudovibrio ascidiaceicola TaxID=285279 RepID=UPI001AD90112|nr:KilA-N domain-containing protein [Pseudovibrio ascidiaceicola]
MSRVGDLLQPHLTFSSNHSMLAARRKNLHTSGHRTRQHCGIFVPGFRLEHSRYEREGGEYNTRKGNKPAYLVLGSYPPAHQWVVRSSLLSGLSTADTRAFVMTLFLSHSINASKIRQRSGDGYLDATAMCKTAGKLFNDYSRLESTKAYLKALSSETGIPVSKLIQSVKGGFSQAQGTWVHPKVAIHLAQWLSPEFAVWCTNIIFDWMVGKDQPQSKPVFDPKAVSQLVECLLIAERDKERLVRAKDVLIEVVKGVSNNLTFDQRPYPTADGMRSIKRTLEEFEALDPKNDFSGDFRERVMQ